MNRIDAGKLAKGTNVKVSLDSGRILIEGRTTGTMGDDGRVPVSFTKVTKNVTGAPVPKNGKVPCANISRM